MTFRALAARLEISLASLQRRCTDLAGLLDLCIDHLAARLPEAGPESGWAAATETRFTALYRLLVAHPGLLVLRGTRPWLGPHLLARLVEPQLADSFAAGMTPEEAITAYRRMYLLTLGSAGFVDHRDPKAAQAAVRTALAALDPESFPALTRSIGEIVPVVSDHEVYYGALRQLIWRAGVDLLSFGATRNGTMTADAIVVFDRSLTAELTFRAKRAGQLASKMRFHAAQLDAYLTDDLWLRNAEHANAMAARLREGLKAIPGVALLGAAGANVLFCRLPQQVVEGLLADDFVFYHGRWEPGVVRFVTSFATTTQDVDQLTRAVARHAT